MTGPTKLDPRLTGIILDGHERAILEILRDAEFGISAANLAQRLGRSPHTALPRMRRLRKLGICAPTFQGTHAVWALVERIPAALAHQRALRDAMATPESLKRRARRKPNQPSGAARRRALRCDDATEMEVRQVIVPAHTAPRLVVNAPRSVFELGIAA